MSPSKPFFPTDPKERSDKINQLQCDYLDEVRYAWSSSVEDQVYPVEKNNLKSHENDIEKLAEFLDALCAEIENLPELFDLKVCLRDLLNTDLQRLPKEYLDDLSNDYPSPDMIRAKAQKVMDKMTAPPSKATLAAKTEHEKKGDKSKFYGHGSFKPGNWWKGQMAARDAGIHGHQIQAIFGKRGQGNGAYSIVVKGKNEADDEDKGETLEYGDHTEPPEDLLSFNIPKDKGSEKTGDAAKDKDSVKYVRVIRGFGGPTKITSGYAPLKGYRYDGLYKVVSQTKNKTSKKKPDKTYTQYNLVRLPKEENQDMTLNDCIRRGEEEMKQWQNDHPN